MEPGKKIGGYRILSPLGAGGMGEVWRAEDEKLGREVALKMLPGEFAGDSERMARFNREAKVLASLNHPHIAHLYGLESISGPDTGLGADENSGETAQPVTFLVMELVEGEDLSERIFRGAIPIDESVSMARQIAEALESAHEQGIVHRDLKPANIKLRPDGTVKVLDFGLAKAWESENADASLSLSPTMTRHATAAGLILGTAAYMAPEQAAGKAADSRADIWAFGVVLWEMLTGHKLFDGETISHVLASVLKDEVDLDELPPEIPPRLRELTGRCLDRQPRSRLQAIGEARIVLEEYERDPNPFDDPAPRAAGSEDRGVGPASRSPWVVAAAAVLIAVVLGLWGVSMASRGEQRKVLRARIPAPEGASFGLEAFAPGAGMISPDGTRIVFTVTDADGERMLWVRPIDHLAARPLPATNGAAYPFWAPDSRQVAYFSGDGKLRKIDTTGGPPVTICVAPNGKGGSWSEEDQIVFAPAHNTAIHLVAAAGGDPRAVTDLPEGVSSHRFPMWLPGGQFAYLARSVDGAENDRVMVASVDEPGSDRELLAAGSNVALAADHLLFIREGTLMAQPFDADDAVFTGDVVPVAEDVLYIAGARYGAFSVSQTGVLIYNMGLVDMQSEIVWLDRRGEEIQQVSTGDVLFDVMLSPDGRSAAVAQLEVSVGSPDIWIYDLERGLSTRFTFDSTNDWYPAWSPDGSRLAFASARSGNEDIWVKDVGGSGRAELLQEGGECQVFPRGWSPDGEWLIYEQVDPANNTDLFAVRSDGSETVALVASPFAETFASISPDGRWLAFVSNESGANEVYVTTFPQPARRWQISTDGGSFPRWRGDSQELFFARANGELFGVEVEGSGETFNVGRVQRLFNWDIAPGFRWPYDAASDGQGFLVIRGMAAAQTDPMAVVLNWDAELEAKKR